jgi:hypothetical protein
MKPKDASVVEQVYLKTRTRLRLKDWESIRMVAFKDDAVQMMIDTYEVKVMVREDRYERKGVRLLLIMSGPSGWYIHSDDTIWDDDFEPFVYEKIGRRLTAEEFQERREWEKMCYRPGTPKTPLDSYDRVWNDKSTPKMEKYW